METQKPLVLVTGSSGLIGEHTINRLADRYQVIGLDIKKSGSPKPKAEYIKMDITSERSVEKVLEQIKKQYGEKIAAIVHLAAYYDFTGAPSDKYEKITVKGSERLLRILHAKAFEVEQFLFSSTNLVYQAGEPGQKIDENAKIEAAWDYPESKVRTEQRLFNQHGEFPLVVMRLAGAYDEMCRSLPLSHQIQRIYEKRFTSHLFSGDLLSGNAFVHLDDIVSAFEKSIDKRRELPQELVLNISEEEAISYDELQDRLGELIYGEEWTTVEVPKPLAKVGAWILDQLGDPFIKSWMIDHADDHYELNTSKAQQTIGWKVHHHLRLTLPQMIEQLKQDPERWYRVNQLEYTDEARKAA